MKALVLLLILLADGKPPTTPVSRELVAIRKQAVGELAKLQTAMLKKGCRPEAADAEAIVAKLMAPTEAKLDKEPVGVLPSETVYEEVLKSWSEAGTSLSTIYRNGASRLQGKEREEAEFFAGWLATFPDLANGIRHLNRRRKFSKLPPVTQDWSGSIGAYYHGIYLKLNPGVKGLAVHREEPDSPGWTPEGAKAAGAILGWTGSAEAMIDMWLNSRFHRNPVLNPACARVTLGGRPGGIYSCRSMNGASRLRAPDFIIWPGDGDTGIPTSFGGELPNPFPQGMTSSGTVISIASTRRLPDGLVYRLLDAEMKPVETVTLDKRPLCFVAKSALFGGTKYTVEVRGPKDFKLTFSFTTR
jgi:hypothetical protein